MGIKHFFSWFKKRFADGIYRLQKGETFADMKEEIIMEDGIVIDNFMIDMNGLFHNSAQKIYEYGNCKPRSRLLGSRRPPQRIGGLQKQMKVFEDVCETLDKVLTIVNPRKRLILCVDGPAPLSKQNQQRQRRFMSALEKESDTSRTFDSNSITPGTKFMDYLTKYIDWYIRKKMSEDETIWSKIEVVFSNEKAPGEGEHKLINFIRQYGRTTESFCIHGMDADLIMLSLGTHIPKFWILREEPMNSNFEFYVIDIGNVRREMGEVMRWNDGESEKKYDIESAINDFIFMCFTVGNDFLPHIPGIEIIEGGIDFMLDVYKNTCETYGHITKNTSKGVRFRRRALKAFLGTVSQYEKGVLQDKLSHKDVFFPDPLLEANAKLVEGKYDLDIEQYRADYYESNLSDVKSMESLCHDYLEGMQWVMTYYTRGVPNWKWRFPYHYAPFAHTIAEHVSTFSFKDYPITSPTVPFIQLLSVLPPKSADLLPAPLDDLLRSESSPMSEYCPDEFPVDLSGKRQTWEGTVILPMVDYAKVERWYFDRIKGVDERDRKRNILGKSFIYSQGVKPYQFHSFYGDFTCKVGASPIDL
jgi:5'-3' exonuclease